MATALNPEMLALARVARGLTQPELESKSGISQGFISRAENGYISVSESRLAALADALGYPPTFFLLEDRALGTRCHHRKRQSMPVRRLSQIEANLNLTRIQILRLLEEVDVPESKYPRFDIEAYDSVEEVASLVRRIWQLPMGPVRDLVGAVEAAGGIVVRADFGTDRLDALSQRAPDGRPFFYLNARAPADRCRLNLAHEVGHIFMHTVGSPGDQEEEAFRFAGALLMPPDEIRPQLSGLTMAKLADLKSYWLVSMQAVFEHAYRLGKITARQRRSFYTRMNQLGYRKREPFDIPEEEPTVVRQIIDLHRNEHRYSITELSEMARLHEAEFRATFIKDEERPRLALVQ